MRISQHVTPQGVMFKHLSFLDRRDLEQIASLEELIQKEGLPADTVQVRPILDSKQALTVAAPVLPRPVLMVHGLAQKADNWVGFKNFFTANPGNRWGGVFRIAEENQFRPDPRANLFAIDLSDNLASPRGMAGEVRRAITAICRATGATQVDVITHSMGGLDAREAVRQGENRIGKLVMLAPPSHGAYEANIAVTASDTGAYEHYPPDRMSAMRDIQLEFGMTGSVENQWLNDLNEFWKAAPNKPATLVLTGVGLPTPDRGKLPGLSQGDGMVAARQAPLEGDRFMVALPTFLDPADANFRDFQQFWYNHLAILNAPDVFREVAEFLAGAQSPPPAPPPPPPASDFEQQLTRVQTRNGEIRVGLAQAEHRRKLARTLQKVGLWTSVSGGVGAALGLAALVTGHTGLGVGLLAGGAAGMGAGTLAQVVYRSRENQHDRDSGLLAEESLNASDDLIHRFRSEHPPG
ncbi:MAG: alpha/beta fold hydrolase [Candidatus Eremiobacterota bacterium]